MVETDSNNPKLKEKLLDALKTNPCFDDDMSDINWAAIDSYNSFEEIFENHKIDLHFKKRLIKAAEQIFEIIKIKEDLKKIKNLWFYKYFFTLFLTDDSKEIYKEIKKELIETLISFCKKENEEILSDIYKFLLLIVYFSFGAYALLTGTVYEEAFLKFQTSTKIDEKHNSNDNKIRKGPFGGFEKEIKKYYPDYSTLRVICKIALRIAFAFGEKLYIPFNQYAEKNGFDAESFFDGIVRKRDLLCLINVDKNDENFDDDDFSSASEEDIEELSWIFEITTLTKEEVEKGISEFMKLNLQDIVFTSSLDFSREKVLKDINDSF